MTRAEAKKILNELQKAVDAVGQKHGVVFEIKGIRYSDETVSARLQGIIAGQDGSTEETEKKLFEQQAALVGLAADDYGRLVHLSRTGKTARVVAVSRKAKKYPVIVKCDDDGTQYKMTVRDFKLSVIA